VLLIHTLLRGSFAGVPDEYVKVTVLLSNAYAHVFFLSSADSLLVLIRGPVALVDS
jgi:hypothetical protein